MNNKFSVVIIFANWAVGGLSASQAGKVHLENAGDLPALPNVDYSLRGYNILAGNPLASGHEADPGFDNSIFEAKYSGAVTADLRYQIPDGFTAFSKTICGIDFVSESFANEKTYQEELQSNVEASFRGYGAALTGSVQYGEMSESMTTDQHTYVKTEAVCGVYEVVMDVFAPPMLRDGFVTAAKMLESDDDDADALLRFVHTYGTHVLSTTHLGAKYAEQTEISKEGKENLERSNVNINVAASYAASFHLGLSNENEIDVSAVEKFESETISRSVVSFGSRPPLDGNALTWANSVFNEPLPISYELLPIQELFSGVFMAGRGVDYERVRPKLEAFLEGYCEVVKDNLGIRDCSGPRGGCSGGNDCHHNAVCTDERTEVNGEELTAFRCACKSGYFGDGVSCYGWNINTELASDLYDDDDGEGDWEEAAFCPNQTYAFAFALKVENEDTFSIFIDDTALNGVKLYCKSFDGSISGEATSGVGEFGSWQGLTSCQSGFLDGFRFRAEGEDADNVFGTNVDMRCETGQVLEGSGINSWGDWSSWTFCPQNARVCGVKTKIEASQGIGDDAGLTNVKMECCEI